MKWTNEAALIAHAESLQGVQLGSINPKLWSTYPSKRTKGEIGRTIEAFFDIPQNARQEPDFPELGIELKVTPLIATQRGVRSKERVSITQINYEDIRHTPFGLSHLRAKTRRVLFVFYEYLPGQPIGFFPIRTAHLWQPTTYENNALEVAYRHVRSAVMAGTAHLLSASDTTLVESATKGSGHNLVSQPNSPIRAPRRAFAFKSSAMTQIYRDITSGTRNLPDEGPSSVDEIDSYIDRMISPWVGRLFDDIQRSVAPETIGAKDKSLVARVARRMMGAPPHSSTVPTLARRGLTIRSTRVDGQTRLPFEATSFPAITYDDVDSMTWEDSPEREAVSDMVFIVFSGNRGGPGDLRFENAVRWRPTTSQIAEMESEWNVLMAHVRSGNLASRPRASDTSFFHIRPHGSNRDDTALLPTGQPFVKSSFWLNRTAVQQVILDSV